MTANEQHEREYEVDENTSLITEQLKTNHRQPDALAL